MKHQAPFLREERPFLHLVSSETHSRASTGAGQGAWTLLRIPGAKSVMVGPNPPPLQPKSITKGERRCCGSLDLCACPQPTSLLLNLWSCAPGQAVGPGPCGCLLPHQGKTQPPPHPPPPMHCSAPHPPTAEGSSLLPGRPSKPTAWTTVQPPGTSLSPA